MRAVLWLGFIALTYSSRLRSFVAMEHPGRAGSTVVYSEGNLSLTYPPTYKRVNPPVLLIFLSTHAV